MMDWVTWTYFFRRLVKNPSFYNLKDTETSTVKSFLKNLVDESAQRLIDHKCVETDDDFNLIPTFLGKLSSFYYIKHESVFYFEDKLKNNMKIEEIVKLLAYSKEFDEIPVRHNEDVLNE